MNLFKTKEQFASAMNDFFQNPAVLSLMAKKLDASNNNHSRIISNIVGNLMHYFVATRQIGVFPELLKDISQLPSNNYNFVLAEKVADALKHQLLAKGEPINVENILSILKNNIFDNGFYMHAFNNSFKASIEKCGINTKSPDMAWQESKSRIDAYSDYEYAFKASRFYVTGDFFILNGYGIISPEWFYSCVKNAEVYESGNITNIVDLVVKNIKNNHSFINTEILKTLKKDASILAKTFINESGIFNIAVFDMNLQSKENDKYFPDFRREEEFNQNLFTKESFLKFASARDESFNLNNKADYDKFVNYVDKIIDFSRLYENSTYRAIEPKDFSIFAFPTLNKIKSSLNEKNKGQLTEKEFEM